MKKGGGQDLKPKRVKLAILLPSYFTIDQINSDLLEVLYVPLLFPGRKLRRNEGLKSSKCLQIYTWEQRHIHVQHFK